MGIVHKAPTGHAPLPSFSTSNFGKVTPLSARTSSLTKVVPDAGVVFVDNPVSPKRSSKRPSSELVDILSTSASKRPKNEKGKENKLDAIPPSPSRSTHGTPKKVDKGKGKAKPPKAVPISLSDEEDAWAEFDSEPNLFQNRVKSGKESHAPSQSSTAKRPVEIKLPGLFEVHRSSSIHE